MINIFKWFSFLYPFFSYSSTSSHILARAPFFSHLSFTVELRTSKKFEHIVDWARSRVERPRITGWTFFSLYTKNWRYMKVTEKKLRESISSLFNTKITFITEPESSNFLLVCSAISKKKVKKVKKGWKWCYECCKIQNWTDSDSCSTPSELILEFTCP